jgi:hypothetical protein
MILIVFLTCIFVFSLTKQQKITQKRLEFEEFNRYLTKKIFFYR